MSVSSKHFHAYILRENDEVEVSIGPIWDSAGRYELPLRLHRSTLEDEVEDIIEDFHELMLKVKSQLKDETPQLIERAHIDKPWCYACGRHVDVAISIQVPCPYCATALPVRLCVDCAKLLRDRLDEAIRIAT